jgi:hypothetical protein
MTTLELSEKTRVLHAALHLATFTVKQLAKLTGVKENTVQTVIARSKELLEETGSLDSGKPGGRATVYRLNDSARARLAREAVGLAETLRGTVVPETDETAHRAEVALDAVASTLELGQLPAGSGERDENWRVRAQSQLKLARELVRLVTGAQRRASLDARLSALESQLATPAPQRTRATAPVEDWFERFQALAGRYQARAALVGGEPPYHGLAGFGRADLSAPAMVFQTSDEHELPDRLAAALNRAQHRVLHVTLRRDVMGELQRPSGREVLLHALQSRPNPAVYVTLDSRKQDSRGMVEGLLGVLEGYLWNKTEHQPATLLDVTLIDTDISSTWVRKEHAVRNLSYYPNVHSASAIDTVIQGFVGGSSTGRFRITDAFGSKKEFEAG